MMIDDDTLKQLLRINDGLFQLCKLLNEKRYGNFFAAHPSSGRPYPHSDRSGQEQTPIAAMTMQPYKGYFIEGTALLVHPFSPDWYIGGSVWSPASSVDLQRGPACGAENPVTKEQ